MAGVGGLVPLAAARGREAKRDLALGVCGGAGGDPDSMRCFDSIGLDYVSCSPFRVPVARVAAAVAVAGAPSPAAAAEPVTLAARHIIVSAPDADGSRDVVELLTLRNPGVLSRVPRDSATPTWA